jgi:hypothetical protein
MTLRKSSLGASNSNGYRSPKQNQSLARPGATTPTLRNPRMVGHPKESDQLLVIDALQRYFTVECAHQKKECEKMCHPHELNQLLGLICWSGIVQIVCVHQTQKTRKGLPPAYGRHNRNNDHWFTVFL